MQEIELKFQIPAEALAALSEQVETLPGHGREHLQAHYVDTPDRRLGQARSALRLRKEGERWVQTLKASGAHAMIRLEDNQPAPPPTEGHTARVDLSLHRGGPTEAALVRSLGWDPENDPGGIHTGLLELYRTDIWRHSARLAVAQHTAQAGVVEMALDLGQIHAGHLSVPVRELEIELVEGHPMAVLHCARDWVQRHGLWLDTQTKAHRGDRLARQAAGEASASTQAAPKSGTDMASCLDQFTDAMSAVSASEQPQPAQVGVWLAGLRSIIALVQAQPQRFSDHLLPSLNSLAQALANPRSDTVALARDPSTTLLCLDLFATLF